MVAQKPVIQQLSNNLPLGCFQNNLSGMPVVGLLFMFRLSVVVVTIGNFEQQAIYKIGSRAVVEVFYIKIKERIIF